MLSFLLRKMWKNKWMMMSLLIGNILLVGIVSSAPMYIHATQRRIFRKAFEQYQTDNRQYPATVELSYKFNTVAAASRTSGYLDMRDNILPEALARFGVPTTLEIPWFTISGWNCQPTIPREENPRSRTLNLIAFQGYESHIRLISGRMPSETVVDGNTIECLANESTLMQRDLLVEELMTVVNMNNTEEPYNIKIVGIYETSDANDYYWVQNPNLYDNTLLVAFNVVQETCIDSPYNEDFRLTASWYLMFDYAAMSIENLPQYLGADEYLRDRFSKLVSVYGYANNFIETVNSFTLEVGKLDLTLWVLQVPIYVLLAFYIFMVSKQILTLEQNAISVLKSRGASRGQILGIYLLQSVFVAGVSLAAGIPLGVWMCRALGSSNGFLNLVQRTALPVDIKPDAIMFALLAAFLSMLTMLAPVLQFSRVTIVDYKRNKSGRSKKALWQRYFLDFLCFGVACYGLYSFNSRRDIMARAFVDVQSVDPLLYLSSSLFIIGLGLLFLRFFPYVMKFVFVIGKLFWPPSVYASLLRVVRSAGDEQFIMIFLIFTLAVGIFDAKAARTINSNSDDKINYTVGTDLVVKEVWANNLPAANSAQWQGRTNPSQDMLDNLEYFEPNTNLFERLSALEEVDTATKVIQRAVTVQKDATKVENVNLMSVDPAGFGNTIWYRGDLLPAHVNYYLNSLALRTDGVLLSANFRDRYGVKVGDYITYTNNLRDTARGYVCGFVSYWPGYTPIERVVNAAGVAEQQDRFLVVSNMNYLNTIWRTLPYEIWMKTNSASNNFAYEYAYTYSARQGEDVLALETFKDAKAEVRESRSDPILQGTNGVLTVGFIVTLLLCFSGFLIFWILSIRSRVLQFGIFRAMGMSMRNIIGLLINEQLFITFSAVGIGAAVGEISARLFVPLIQISYSASEQVIPLQLATEAKDYANLFTVVGFMIAVCLLILGVLISKVKIAQALKLGED